MNPSRVFFAALGFVFLLSASHAHSDDVESPIRGSDVIVSPEGEARILLDLELPIELDPATTAIGDAILRVPLASVSTDSEVTLGVYAISTPWVPGGADWSGGWERAGGDFEEGLSSRTSIPARATSGELSIDVTMILRGALDGEPYEGLLLMVPPGSAEALDAERAEALRLALDHASFEVITRKVPPPPRGR